MRRKDPPDVRPKQRQIDSKTVCAEEYFKFAQCNLCVLDNRKIGGENFVVAHGE